MTRARRGVPVTGAVIVCLILPWANTEFCFRTYQVPSRGIDDVVHQSFWSGPIGTAPEVPWHRALGEWIIRMRPWLGPTRIAGGVKG